MMEIVEKTHIYYQDHDTCDSNVGGQYLTVQTQNSGVGHFLIIKTERWSIDEYDVDKFCDTLKQILKEMNTKPITRAPNDE